MTNVPPHPELDSSSTVAALGLRWAALRGMLSSPLINAEEQKSLRDDLIRELRSVERSIGSVDARNEFEISAKIDVAKEAAKNAALGEAGWFQELLESLRRDVLALAHQRRSEKPTLHPVRNVVANTSQPARSEG